MRLGVLVRPEGEVSTVLDNWAWGDTVGLHHGWCFDHVRWRDAADKPWFAALPVLAGAACLTSRIRLGTLVSTPNFRDPVPFAKELVTLDHLSSGRLTAGLGAGGGGYDANLRPPHVRVGFRDFVTTLVSTLQGDGADTALPRPLQRPSLPLAIAGAGPRGMSLAVQHGDIWVTNGVSASPGAVAPRIAPDVVAGQLRALDEACARADRPPGSLRRLALLNARDGAFTTSRDLERLITSYSDLGVTDVVIPAPTTPRLRAAVERYLALSSANDATE